MKPLFTIAALLLCFAPIAAFAAPASMPAAGKITPPASATPATHYDIVHTDTEWRRLLTPAQYHILREQGTEPSGTGKYNNFYKKGTYVCAATGEPLFSSVSKYDAHEGWPSFWAPISRNAVLLVHDRTYGLDRTEVVDARSGSHLGHLFTDGPKPTGLRYCMDSDALIFVPAGAKMPPVAKPTRAH